MTKNIFIPIKQRILKRIKWWESKQKTDVIRGSFNYELYQDYLRAVNDNSFIIQKPK